MGIVNKLLRSAKQAAARGGSTGRTRGTTGAPRRSGTGRPATGGGAGGGAVGKVLRGLRKR
ncbi:hypothetical protein [uncultured Pseudokineococcus sp.]|uniref:hypothetical protein n=1 Tax=uncultured Pseudokineococcus sp. TaxID=1642928 RepID=UPI00262AC393|nr:hypothetical protein [uncultured Pseudokineococcus sp.]